MPIKLKDLRKKMSWGEDTLFKTIDFLRDHPNTCYSMGEIVKSASLNENSTIIGRRLRRFIRVHERLEIPFQVKVFDATKPYFCWEEDGVSKGSGEHSLSKSSFHPSPKPEKTIAPLFLTKRSVKKKKRGWPKGRPRKPKKKLSPNEFLDYMKKSYESNKKNKILIPEDAE